MVYLGKAGSIHDGIAAKLQFLFEVYRKAGGESYSYREVERLTSGKISNVALSRLAEGKVIRPNQRTLQALTDFFDLQPDFWERPLTAALQAETRENKEVADRQYIVALARDLEPEDVEAVISIMERLKQRSRKPFPTP